MREVVKKDPKIIAKFKEYGVSIAHIDSVPISFCSMDVSAKTKDKEIFFNRNMLDDENVVEEHIHYLFHEIIHFLQQKTGKNLEEGQEEDEYLDKVTEEEAFSVQIDEIKDSKGLSEAERYTDQLLDHHDLDGEKGRKKKDELLNGG